MRAPADFFAVAVEDGARYLRKIWNVSAGGLLIEDRLPGKRPGDLVELELPRPDAEPMRVTAEVVYVTATGKVGLAARVDAPLEGFGGEVAL